MRTSAFVRFLVILCLQPVVALAQWVPTSGPLGGTPYGFGTLHDAHGATIFAGTSDGVFRSTDDGISWVHSGLAGTQIFSITQLAAQFASSDSLFASGLRNVYRSTDGGASWTSSFTASGGLVKGLVAHGSQLFLALGPDQDSLGTGVYTSTNGGDSWSKLITPASFNDIQAIASNGANIVAATRNHGVWYSTTNGATWLPTNYPPLTAAFVLRESLGTLYAGSTSGILISTNNGLDWTRTASAGLDSFDHIDDLTINGATMLAIVQGRAFISQDAGSSWASEVFAPVSSASSYHAVFYTGTSYLSGTDRGVTRSLDAVSWKRSNTGELAASAQSMIAYQGTLFTLSNLGGVARSTDQGAHWLSNDSTDLASQVLFGFDTANGSLFVYGFGLWQWSVDQGVGSWQKVSARTIPSLLVHNAVMLFADADGSVLRSTDNGANWTTITSGLSAAQNRASFLLNSGSNVINVVQFLDPNYKGERTVFYFSTNDGLDWSRTDSIARLLGPTDAADTHGLTLVNTSSGSELFASTDHGAHWSSFPAFPPSGVTVKLLKPFRGGIIAFGTHQFGSAEAGLFFSPSGVNWTNIANGLSNGAVVTSIAEDGAFAYAGVDNESVWKRSIATFRVERSAALAQAVTLFPNPATIATSARFTLSQPARVTLSIYDTRGVMVKQLASEQLSAGPASIPLSLSDLESGAYQLLANIDGEASTTTLIVSR